MRRDDCGGAQPFMGLTQGIELIVDDENFDAAKEVLDRSAQVADPSLNLLPEN